MTNLIYSIINFLEGKELKEILFSYFSDIFILMLYKLTRMEFSGYEGNSAVVHNRYHVFKKYWELEKSKQTNFCVLQRQLISIFKNVILFRSYRILDYLTKTGALINIPSDVLVQSMCDLLSDGGSWKSQKMLDTLIWCDPTGYFAYSSGFNDDMIIAASSCTDPWSLDFIQRHERGESWFFSQVPALELLQHIRMDNFDMVKAMVDKGFNIHVEDDAALSVASRNCNIKIIKYLLNEGASLRGHNYKAVRKALVHGDHQLNELYLNTLWPDIYADRVPIDLAISLVNRVLMGEQDQSEAGVLSRELIKLREKKAKLEEA